MIRARIIFPNQLFENVHSFRGEEEIWLVEEVLFFSQYPFHKQKLIYHRATMQFYRDYLIAAGYTVHYVSHGDRESDIRILISALSAKNVNAIRYYDPIDDWLQQRIQMSAQKHSIKCLCEDSPMFMNSEKDLRDYFKKNKFFQTSFYIDQRKRRNVLIDAEGKPFGGDWTYDVDNRKKYPKGKLPPKIGFNRKNRFVIEAVDYVKSNFEANPGNYPMETFYPVTFEEAKYHLKEFLENRLHDFGKYEDAMVESEAYLHHSVLTPMLNTGLLTPVYVLNETLKYAANTNIPINSLEGFVRQILGWREYIRAVYIHHGRKQRSQNFWGFSKQMPKSYWEGNTGLDPVDKVIDRVLKYAYCHHIERLMILGNSMLLLRLHPDDVYEWFMSLFIDAYDWVMVPNVYGMSQYADGGLMSTKPYISGSNYVVKMSDYKKGTWCDVWDSLFWSFMVTNRSYFSRNARLNMLLSSWDKKPESKKWEVLEIASSYLQLD